MATASSSFTAIFFSSAFAACFAEVCTIPLDTAKVRLQLQRKTPLPAPPAAAAAAGGGMLATIMCIAREEGVAALWKGVIPGLHRQFLYGGLRIGLYEPVKAFFVGGAAVGDVSLLSKILAALTTGVIAIVVANPTDLVKVRLQADGKANTVKRSYSGALNAYATIIRQEGIGALWTGLGPNVARNAIINAAELASYDQFKQMFLKLPGFTDNVFTHLLAGLGAGFFAVCIGSPVDVVKSRMMGDSTYRSTLDCFAKTLKNDGPGAFYKGFIANFCRIGSWNVIMFLTLEQVSAMAFDLLPALRPRQWRSTICVRVCRKWEYRGGTDDGPIQHIDLVLVDEKGNNMYGEIPEPEVETKGPLLEEGGIYVISRFRVSNAKSGYRPVDSPYMVEFTLHTTISAARTDMPAFPQYAYRLIPIDALPSHAGDTRNFLDTIGLLVEVSEAYRVRLPNKPAPTLTRHIVLRDLSYSEIKITLWGHRAAAFNTNGVYNRTEAKPIIVLFVGGLMKSYQGTYYLSANTASRWYFNPAIPEAHQFSAGCQGQRLEIRFVPAPREDQAQGQAPAQRVEKTLRELNDMDPYDFAENGYRCTVTIGRLTPNASWWFPSCSRCSKSCVPDGTGYKCNACSSTSFKFKYKVSFVALDGTDEAEMICFGDVARRIIGKPVQQLLRSSLSPNTYPQEIARIASLRFTFAVALTQQSYYRQQKTYQVVSMITAYGRHQAPGDAAQNENGGHPDNSGGDQSSSQATSHGIEEVSDATLSSPVLTSTPPPVVQINDPPSVKSQARDVFEKDGHPGARKRLSFENENADQLVSEDSQEIEELPGHPDQASTDMAQKSDETGKELAHEKKRSRGDHSLAQESG